jgi:hypothetical protein
MVVSAASIPIKPKIESRHRTLVRQHDFRTARRVQHFLPGHGPLAARLEQMGIATIVTNYLAYQWRSPTKQQQQDIRAGASA